MPNITMLRLSVVFVANIAWRMLLALRPVLSSLQRMIEALGNAEMSRLVIWRGTGLPDAKVS